MILSDREIIERVKTHQMIAPFIDYQVSDGVISYGLSSYGYDFRVANEFKVFQTVSNGSVDPKNLSNEIFKDVVANRFYLVPPHCFILARSVEYFRIPRDILTICLGKSTYARSGVLLNVTPFEPEWEGYATLEIYNTTPFLAKIYVNEGIGQIIFLRASVPCAVSYADRAGKYQKQRGVTLPKISG